MKLVSIFEQIAEACLVLDSTGQVLFANEPAARLLGQSLDELKTVPEDSTNGLPLRNITSTVAETLRPLHARHFYRERWYELHATPAGDGVLLLIWESDSASPDLRRLEQQLQRLITQLDEATRELESLSYTVSHDLRAPLRHVEAFIGLLKQNLAGKTDPGSTEYLGIIEQSARQMAHLLDGVLSYSRLCRRDINLTAVNLDHALKATLQELKLESDGRQVVWEIESLPQVEADPWMIRQALSEIIGNALKFTRPRSPARIRINSTSNDDEIIVRIEDNGIGFDMQYAERLFGLFQRLHSDPQFEGNGVGLAHVRRMIQRQGGRVWAEAKPNSGATFFIALSRPSASP